MNKNLFILASTCICTIFTSCTLLPDSGPVNIVRDHKYSRNGVNYNVIDINSLNISEHNTTQHHKSDKLPSTNSKRTYADSIQKGDLLNLFIIDPTEGRPFIAGQNSGPLEVSQDGNANLPFIGSIKVQGKSLSAVEHVVREEFALQFNSAEVSVSRSKNIQFRANAIGLVTTPGQHVINRPDFTLADLVALSGGTQIDPHLCEFKLHRDNKTYILDHKQIAKNDTLIQDGDLLEVARSKYQHLVIIGNVNQPGNHPFPSAHSHLTDFIGASSGINLNNGDPSGIFIFRQKPEKKTNVYRFNLRQADGLIAANKFHLHGGDVIYVTEAPLSRWNRILRNALPIGQIQGVQGLTR